MSSRSSQAWSNYWASGKVSTFGGIETASSAQSLTGLWGSYLGPLTTGNKCLDVGCGNGSLGQMILEIASGQSQQVDITGVDTASLPHDLEVPEGMTLLGDTRVEELPFVDGGFDRVLSQFGFEYADIPAAVKEVKRVIKADGRVNLIGHHLSSWVCRDSFDILRQMAQAEESALIVSVERLLTRLDMLRSEKKNPEQDADANNLRKLVNGTVQELEKSAKESNNPGFTISFLNSVMAVFKEEMGGLEAHRTYLKDLSTSIIDYGTRLNSQKEVARDDAGWQEIRTCFEAEGFNVVRFEPCVINGYHFGQYLEATP